MLAFSSWSFRIAVSYVPNHAQRAAREIAARSDGEKTLFGGIQCAARGGTEV